MRDILDRYYTPYDLAAKLVQCIGINQMERMSILEPSSGDGAFIASFGNHHDIFACDLDPDSRGLNLVSEENRFNCNFLCLDCSDVDWIIGNPPYNDAKSHCEHAIKNARKGVAFLLRVGFLASEDRREFWEKYPPTRTIILCNRPSFTNNGRNGQYDYAFFVWEKGAERKPVEWI